MTPITINKVNIAEGVDYTVEYTVNVKGRQGIVSVSGVGDFKNVASKTYTLSLEAIISATVAEFDHMIWIIPAAFVALIGAAALTFFIIKKTRKRKKKSQKSPDGTPPPKAETVEEAPTEE